MVRYLYVDTRFKPIDLASTDCGSRVFYFSMKGVAALSISAMSTLFLKEKITFVLPVTLVIILVLLTFLRISRMSSLICL